MWSMSGFANCQHVLDQDEYWRDEKGRYWLVNRIPPDTARELLDGVRNRSLSTLMQYTAQLTESAEQARRMGEDVALEWEPDSIPYFDHCAEIELTAGNQNEQIATSMAWLDAKPLIRALERRALGLDT